MFEKLIAYENLAWDFDDTIIGHELSPKFWDFIIQNPYDQVHHIITMRSHGWEDVMFEELAAKGSQLERKHFSQIINAPNRMFESYSRCKTFDAVHEDHPYLLFKGEQCRKIGAQVLIDDMEDNGVSNRGCEVHDIVHLHPDDLL